MASTVLCLETVVMLLPETMWLRSYWLQTVYLISLDNKPNSEEEIARTEFRLNTRPWAKSSDRNKISKITHFLCVKIY